MTVLVGLGIVLTAISAWRVRGDILAMAHEERDIEWVRETGRAGLPLIFLDDALRRRIFQAHVQTGTPVAIPDDAVRREETLLDGRARRVQLASGPDGGVIVPAELRGIAEVRTSEYGGFARYATSLLLLLAVLGTFAGVKTALPELIRSVNAATNATTSVAQSNEGLVSALGAVAAAFGGNALALVGAVAVGLMAQGVGFGRRNLLERLELVSAEYLYGQNVAAEANPMQTAIVALGATAREMHSASGAMLGIEGGLQALGTEFRGSLDLLADRLRDIAARQEEGLYDRTADTLLELQRRMDDLARGVESNAQVYAGLAEAVRTRSRETEHALGQMRQTNALLADALRGILEAGQRSSASFDQLRAGVEEMRQGSAGVREQTVALVAAVGEVQPVIRTLAETVGAADDRLRASEAQSRQEWRALGDQVGQRLDAAAGALGEAVAAMRSFDERAATALDEVRRTAVTRRDGGGHDPEVARLLREISAGLRPGRGPRALLQAAAAPLLGVLIGGGAMYALLRLAGG